MLYETESRLMANPAILEKWKDILDSEKAPKIKSNYVRHSIAKLLENQTDFSNQNQLFMEAAPSNNIGSGNVKTFDPVLISMVRRAYPMLIAYDVCGVQTMSGPTGLIFALRARYGSQTGTEAWLYEPNSDFSGQAAGEGGAPWSANVASWDFTNVESGGYTGRIGTGMETYAAEHLGDSETSNTFNQMAISIDKITATAKSRALKAEYTTELAQDLKAIHGQDAEEILSDILAKEILAEINREIIRTIYVNAQVGAAGATSAGTFNLDSDADGRWSAEKFAGLDFQLKREASAIQRLTRRGRGNLMICTPDVASALESVNKIIFNDEVSMDLDLEQSTFVGMTRTGMKVFVDPYYDPTKSSNEDYAVVGYRGSRPEDAGIFYAPYIPLEMARTIGEEDFQPRIAFKTRYAVVTNPFVSSTGAVETNSNQYYRKFKITNLV